jgi:mycothiol system anti-sigma-R factor
VSDQGNSLDGPCGASGGNCEEILARMVFFVDNELDDADCATIQQHLDDCTPCLADFDVERAVKALVARSCCETAPEELRERVRVTIRQVHVTDDATQVTVTERVTVTESFRDA